MPSFVVTSPDGQKFKVNAPEGATKEQVIDYAKKQFTAAKPEAKQPEQAQPQGGRFDNALAPFRMTADAIKAAPGAIKYAVTNPVATYQSLETGLTGGTAIPLKGAIAAPLAYAAQDIVSSLPNVIKKPLGLENIEKPDARELLQQTQQVAYDANQPQRDLAAEHPILDVGLQIAGGLTGAKGLSGTTAAKAARYIASGGNLTGKLGTAARVAGSAALGEASTEAYAAGTAKPGEREQAAREIRGVGAVIGGSVPLVAAAAARSLAPKVATPTAEQLRDKASLQYKVAEQAGGSIKPQAADKFLDDIASIRTKDEIARELGGKDFIAENAGVFESMRGKPITLKRASAIDQRLTELLDNETVFGKPSQNGRQILLAREKLRNLMSNITDADVEGGKQGFEAYKKAREMWAQAARMRDVESIINRASGMEQPATGIRSGFRALLNNPDRLKGFSKEEISAIKRASQTGIVGNLFRAFGSGLTPLVAGGAGLATSGPVGSLISGAAGYGLQQGSKSIGTAMQMSRAKKVADLIARPTGQAANTMGALAGVNPLYVQPFNNQLVERLK